MFKCFQNRLVFSPARLISYSITIIILTLIISNAQNLIGSVSLYIFAPLAVAENIFLFTIVIGIPVGMYLLLAYSLLLALSTSIISLLCQLSETYLQFFQDTFPGMNLEWTLPTKLKMCAIVVTFVIRAELARRVAIELSTPGSHRTVIRPLNKMKLKKRYKASPVAELVPLAPVVGKPKGKLALSPMGGHRKSLTPEIKSDHVVRIDVESPPGPDIPAKAQKMEEEIMQELAKQMETGGKQQPPDQAIKQDDKTKGLTPSDSPAKGEVQVGPPSIIVPKAKDEDEKKSLSPKDKISPKEPIYDVVKEPIYDVPKKAIPGQDLGFERVSPVTKEPIYDVPKQIIQGIPKEPIYDVPKKTTPRQDIAEIQTPRQETPLMDKKEKPPVTPQKESIESLQLSKKEKTLPKELLMGDKKEAILSKKPVVPGETPKKESRESIQLIKKERSPATSRKESGESLQLSKKEMPPKDLLISEKKEKAPSKGALIEKDKVPPKKPLPGDKKEKTPSIKSLKRKSSPSKVPPESKKAKAPSGEKVKKEEPKKKSKKEEKAKIEPKGTLTKPGVGEKVAEKADSSGRKPIFQKKDIKGTDLALDKVSKKKVKMSEKKKDEVGEVRIPMENFGTDAKSRTSSQTSVTSKRATSDSSVASRASDTVSLKPESQSSKKSESSKKDSEGSIK